MKVCKVCAFEHEKRQCPACLREYMRARNPLLKEYYRKWVSDNKERLAKRRAELWANPEYREKMLQKRREYRKANPEKKRIENHNYKSKKRTTGRLSKNIVQKLMVLQKGRCACCSRKLGSDYHVDHIVPIAMGGQNVDSNVQLLTSTCNMQKGKKHPVEFMQERGFLI